MPKAEQPASLPPVADRTVAFDPADAGWEPYRDEGFIGLVGPFWRRPSGDSYLYAFLAEPKHHNRRGIVQGGMLMTFADRSMGMTCWYANGRQPQATVQLDVHFIDAVQIGEFVEAKCRVGCGRRWVNLAVRRRRLVLWDLNAYEGANQVCRGADHIRGVGKRRVTTLREKLV